MPVNSGTIQLTCRNGDGDVVTATLSYTPATGALTGLVATNSSARSTRVTISSPTDSRNVSVPSGTTTLTPGQLSAAGFTNLSQVQGIELSAP